MRWRVFLSCLVSAGWGMVGSGGHGFCSDLGLVHVSEGMWAGFGDEPESLILAQSERWRHA